MVLGKAGSNMPVGRTAFVGGLLLAAGLAGFAATARAEDGPFSGLSGSWAGTGTIQASNGTKERIRCRAKYSVPPSGQALHQELRCASDSYKFEVNSNVVAEAGGRVQGQWQELTRQAVGAVTGTASPGAISTQVSGTGFSATLTVSTKNDRQVVSIRPTGTDITAVDIDMTRS